MEISQIDAYFFRQEEPAKGCLLALRTLILSQHEEISMTWRYGMPFFNYKGKRFCYLWVHKKSHLPYIGFVDGNLMNHPELVQEKRARMKILLVDPQQDLPQKLISLLLKEAIHLCK